MSALEPGTHRNARGSLHLVPSEHPDLYASASQTFNSKRDLVLELIFDSRDAQQLHVRLQLVDTVLYTLFSIVKVCFRFLIFSVPVLIKRSVNQLLTYHQSPQTLTITLITHHYITYFARFSHASSIVTL